MAFLESEPARKRVSCLPLASHALGLLTPGQPCAKCKNTQGVSLASSVRLGVLGTEQQADCPGHAGSRGENAPSFQSILAF